jgi:hypothetical protein
MTISQDEAGTKDADGEYAIRIAASIDAFTREEWDGFSGASRDCAETAYNPFVSYDFLSIVEESGCAVRRSGWQGYHLRLEAPEGTAARRASHLWASLFALVRVSKESRPLAPCAVKRPLRGRPLVARDP